MTEKCHMQFGTYDKIQSHMTKSITVLTICDFSKSKWLIWLQILSYATKFCHMCQTICNTYMFLYRFCHMQPNFVICAKLYVMHICSCTEFVICDTNFIICPHIFPLCIFTDSLCSHQPRAPYQEQDSQSYTC